MRASGKLDVEATVAASVFGAAWWLSQCVQPAESCVEVEWSVTSKVRPRSKVRMGGMQRRTWGGGKAGGERWARISTDAAEDDP